MLLNFSVVFMIKALEKTPQNGHKNKDLEFTDNTVGEPNTLEKYKQVHETSINVAFDMC